MAHTKEYTTKINSERLSKTIGALAKINIGLGLLMLLTSVGEFAFIKEAHYAVDKFVLTQLNYFRHRKITEEEYESRLKQTTFLRLCIHFGWKIGLVYSIFLMTTNVLLLVAMVRNKDRLLCCWLTITFIFDLGVVLIITAAFLVGQLLLDTIFSVLFFLVSLLFLGLPTIPLCWLLYKYRRTRNVLKKEDSLFSPE